MAPYSCSDNEILMKKARENMAVEMSTGAEGTAQNFSDFARLERLWLAEATADGAAGVTPAAQRGIARRTSSSGW